MPSSISTRRMARCHSHCPASGSVREAAPAGLRVVAHLIDVTLKQAYRETPIPNWDRLGKVRLKMMPDSARSF